MPKVEMLGKRFGRLVVIAEGEKRQNSRECRWICKCDCGNVTHPICGSDLRNGHTKSCGCLHTEIAIKTKTIHNKCNSRLYRIYANMKARCFNPKNTHFNHYGGRGITICSEWIGKDGFQHFYDWAMANGYSDDLTIDRIDVNGNYEPSNCRWADGYTQLNNTRKNVYVEINGKKQTFSQWARECGIDRATIQWRYYAGLRGVELIQPLRRKKENHEQTKRN